MKTEMFLIFWKFWNFLNFRNFEFFLKISEFSLIDDEVQVFRINIKLLFNPVAELKIRENDSHCRSIVLKTMDRSIVKQLEKEKNSNFNVEHFAVMFIYWGTINEVIVSVEMFLRYSIKISSWLLLTVASFNFDRYQFFNNLFILLFYKRWPGRIRCRFVV